jgi:uncharacterized glyoxalase superfamily protein PhnB
MDLVGPALSPRLTARVSPGKNVQERPAGRPDADRVPITPHTVVQGADAAAAFYRDAFGAEEIERIPTPDGRLTSLQLSLDGTMMDLADEFPEMGVLAQPSIGGTVILPLEVADAEAAYAQAIAAAPSSASRWPRRPGAIATASSSIRSGTAGTSPSACATSPTTRS